MIHARVDSVMRSVLPWIIGALQKRRVRRVAFYGAGSHTAQLLPLWRNSGGPEVIAILTTQAGTTRTMFGLPVVPIGALDAERVEAVVLSSETFEHELRLVCEERSPELPVIAPWSMVRGRPLGSGLERDLFLSRLTVPVIAASLIAGYDLGEVVLCASDAETALVGPIWRAWTGCELRRMTASADGLGDGIDSRPRVLVSRLDLGGEPLVAPALLLHTLSLPNRPESLASGVRRDGR